MEYDVLISPSVALAGLLLVFVGFLLNRAKSFGTRTGDRPKLLAMTGLFPIALALISAALCTLEAAMLVDFGYGPVALFLGTLLVTVVYALIAVRNI